jgi:hypothetical protein
LRERKKELAAADVPTTDAKKPRRRQYHLSLLLLRSRSNARAGLPQHLSLARDALERLSNDLLLLPRENVR